jgi:signal transduction histidine kinase
VATVPASDEARALWLATLQRALGRASHDVKDALNGVSVNLEVLRSRAAKADRPAASLAPFADAASQQLDRLTTLLEAVLALGRTEREPADVGVTLRRVVILCAASASSSDAAVDLQDGMDDSSMATAVGGDVVRLALAAPVLAAVAGMDRASRASAVTCSIAADDRAVRVTIAAEGRTTRMPAEVARVVRDAGVVVDEETQDLSLAFPRA